VSCAGNATTMSESQEQRPSDIKVWLHATRPHTLTASISPIIVGSSLISLWDSRHNETTDQNGSGTTRAIAIVGFAFFAALVQIGTNLHNDYADFIKGADDENRVGQVRATQKGWLTPTQTATAATLCLLLASTIGFCLTKLSEHIISYDPFMHFVTITSVFNAFCYTGGHYPLGYIGLGNLSLAYSGLGDLFAFLYFGLVATITPLYLYCRINLHEERTFFDLVWESGGFIRTGLVVAVPIGLFATAIIVVNNLRDRKTDAVVGKRTMAVRLGEKITRLEYTALIGGAYLMMVPISTEALLGGKVDNPGWLYLPLLSLPMAWRQLKAVGFYGKDGAALNEHVGGTARVQLVYCLLLSIGIRLAR